jgi:hypothetical protein
MYLASSKGSVTFNRALVVISKSVVRFRMESIAKLYTRELDKIHEAHKGERL